MHPKSFADEVVEYSAKLKGYARKLAGKRPIVEDIVQETIFRALVYSDQFEPGTNLSAWLHTILRNCYFSELRQSRRLTELSETNSDQPRASGPDQIWTVRAKETAKHISALPRVQREALSLVAVDGNSYETAAIKTGCACGTMKSRVSRARSALLEATHGGGNARAADRDFFRRDLEHLESAA